MALRQLTAGARRYSGACIVAILLVFFASMIGRMDTWLGADGKGMMDAFNPADHDIGVQIFGNIPRRKRKKPCFPIPALRTVTSWRCRGVCERN